jgi:uncharacterized protein YjiS (DUF1127 family)
MGGFPATGLWLHNRTRIFIGTGVLGGPPVPNGKETTMSNLVRTIRQRLEQYRRYVRTRDEIARMPLDVALDLDIYPGDAERIARKAVWG